MTSSRPADNGSNVEVERLPIVAVIGSGGRLDEDAKLAPRRAGELVARSGHHLLTGGGGGVMEAASEGFCSVPKPERTGLCIGVLPAGRPATQYPNPWVELPIVTHLAGEDPRGPGSRNHINVRTAHAVVAFPGGGGTHAELEIALALGHRPIVWVAGEQRIGPLGVSDLDQLAVTRITDEHALALALRATLQIQGVRSLG